MSLKAFLAQNAVQTETKEVYVSKRFIEDGKSVPFVIKAITEGKNSQIRAACMSFDVNKGKGKKNFDSEKYLRRMCVASVVSPELDNAELQESYGVVGAEELLVKMLLPGEYAALLEAIQKLNGFEAEDFEEKEEEVKNS